MCLPYSVMQLCANIEKGTLTTKLVWYLQLMLFPITGKMATKAKRDFQYVAQKPRYLYSRPTEGKEGSPQEPLQKVARVKEAEEQVKAEIDLAGAVDPHIISCLHAHNAEMENRILTNSMFFRWQGATAITQCSLWGKGGLPQRLQYRSSLCLCSLCSMTRVFCNKHTQCLQHHNQWLWIQRSALMWDNSYPYSAVQAPPRCRRLLQPYTLCCTLLHSLQVQILWCARVWQTLPYRNSLKC